MMKRAHLVWTAMAVLLASTVFVGCNVVNTSAAPTVSIFGTDPVPVLYKLTAAGNVVKVSMDRSREGVVLNATLDEYELPTVWAKVTGTAGNYKLQGVTVDPAGADAAKFVLGNDSVYYAKQIRLGPSTDTKILTATAAGSSVVYADSTPTLTLPDSALSDANKKWYWDQMAAGEFAVWDGSADRTGMTYASPLKSANDALWKSGRDGALAFVVGRVLTGSDKLPVAKSAGAWSLGSTETGIADTWTLDTYLPMFLAAYASSAGADVTTAASVAE